AANLNVSAAGSVVIADGASVSGLIDAIVAGSGDVAFNGSSTVAGIVGSSGRLASVTAGAASSTTQFDATTFKAEAIGFSTGTTLFTASAPTLSGDVTVSNGGTLQFSSAAGGNIAASGGADTGALDLGGSSSTLKLAMTDVGTFAALTVAGTANMQNANIYIDTTGATSAITSGTTITIVNSTGVLSNGDVVVASTAAAVTFTSTSDGNNVYLTTSRTGGGYAGAATGSSTSVVGGVATALNGLVTSATAGSTMATLVAKLDTLSAQTLGETLTQLSPTSVAATTGASMATTTAAVNVVGTRTETVRLASNGSGVASGEAMRGLGVWAQGFGVYGNQDKRNGYDGYDVATGGLALGADTRFFKNMRTGVSFSYARSGIDATDTTAGNTTDINSYIGSIYTTYEGKPWYLDGVVSFGMHDYDTTRKIAALTQTINGDHKGYQTTVKLGGGYPIQVKKAVVTPLASFTYSNLSEGSYTETGGSAALVVDSKSTHSYRSGLGAKIATTFDVKGKAVTPEARAVWSHEFGDNQDTTAKFAGGGAYFTSKADTPARESVNLGVGLNVDLKNNISLSATYDAELKDKYLGHTGTVQVRAEF
ncbi:MAG: autotransporter domain-containing protein, partial [Alphaproteobacteria bacterium]|nr:autotransporter domain-containing protein [Alphaproteobacteria bacterium]